MSAVPDRAHVRAGAGIAHATNVPCRRGRFSAADIRSSMLLYSVTDRRWLHGRRLADVVRDAIAGGATFIQLREKHASRDQIVAMARELVDLCRDAGVPFVLDDEVAIAAEVGADGVHVGQDDLACAEARRLLGPDAIIGVSAHTVAQARAAQAAGADYIGAGALIATPTKPDAAVVSARELRRMTKAVDIPVVGIGGLNARTVEVLAGSGAAGAAVVSALFAAADPAAAARELRRRIEDVLAQPALPDAVGRADRVSGRP